MVLLSWVLAQHGGRSFTHPELEIRVEKSFLSMYFWSLCFGIEDQDVPVGVASLT
jgi:hypothetical protein